MTTSPDDTNPDAGDLAGWRPIETAPYSTWVLTWLYLPKNPPASGHAIAQRCCVSPGTEIPDEGIGARESGCWWVNGRYYPPSHVTHWMPLPPPPTTPDRQGDRE